MIDPISIGLALTGIQKAVSLVKQAAKTAQDVQSLVPMVADLFDAKHTAVKAMKDGKQAGGSNLGIAMKIEVALMEAAAIEQELQMLFFMSGKADVWEKIKAREKDMNAQDKWAAKAAEDKAKAKKKENEEALTIILAAIAVLSILGFFGFVFIQVHDLKAEATHGYHPKK